MALSFGFPPVTVWTKIQKSIFYRFNNFMLNNTSLSSKDLMVSFKKTNSLLFYIQNATLNWPRTAPREKTGVTEEYRLCGRLVCLKISQLNLLFLKSYY